MTVPSARWSCGTHVAEPDYSEDEESHTGATQCQSFSWEY
jgi:hypothetical protein